MKSETQAKKKSTPRKANKTREAILNKAEELFANYGIDAYSLRKIAEHAQVEPPMITYHFGNKNDLVDAVIERRISFLNNARLKSLGETLRRTKNRPSVEDILRATYDPWLEMYQSGDPGWRNYSRLIGRMLIMPWQTQIIEKHMGETETHLLNAFALALPHLSDEEVFWGASLTLGSAILLFSDSPRLTQLVSHLDNSTLDIGKGYEVFIQNAARGFPSPEQ